MTQTPHLDAVRNAPYRLPYMPSWWRLLIDFAEVAKDTNENPQTLLWRLRMAAGKSA